MNEIIDPANTFSKIHIQNLFQDKYFNVPDEPQPIPNTKPKEEDKTREEPAGETPD